jgi:hypothetical protein
MSRRIIWARHVAHKQEEKNIWRILVKKSEGNGALRIHRHKLEDNIKVDLKEVER